jgi:hypothetical protein
MVNSMVVEEMTGTRGGMEKVALSKPIKVI